MAPQKDKEAQAKLDPKVSPEALQFAEMAKNASLKDPQAFAARCLEAKKLSGEVSLESFSQYTRTLIQMVKHEEKRFDRLLDISRDELFGNKAALSPQESIQAVALAQRHCAIESRLLQNSIDRGSPMSESSVKMAGYKAIETSLSQEREMTKKFMAANHTPFQAALLAAEIMRIKDVHDILLGTQTPEQRSQMLASLEPKQAALEKEFQIKSDALMKAQELEKAAAQKQNVIQGIPVSEETMGFAKRAKNANLKDPQSFAVRCLEEKNILLKQGHELTAKHIQSLIQRVQHEEKRFDRLLDISRDALFDNKAVLSPLESMQVAAVAQRHCAIESRLSQNAIDSGTDRSEASIKMEGYKAIETSIAQEKELTAQFIAANHFPPQAAILASEIMRVKDIHGVSLREAQASPMAAAVQQVLASLTQEKERQITQQPHLTADKTILKDYAQYVMTITAREYLKEVSLKEASVKDAGLRETDIDRILHKSLSETASIEKFEALIKQQRQMEKQMEQSRSMGMDR
jgi:hypothetical protein